MDVFDLYSAGRAGGEGSGNTAPAHSALNQVEIWFAQIEGKVIAPRHLHPGLRKLIRCFRRPAAHARMPANQLRQATLGWFLW